MLGAGKSWKELLFATLRNRFSKFIVFKYVDLLGLVDHIQYFKFSLKSSLIGFRRLLLVGPGPGYNFSKPETTQDPDDPKPKETKPEAICAQIT